MCGIAGLVSYQDHGQAIKEVIQRMTNAQRHRGPDDAGLEVLVPLKPTVVFGHRRLAIIDLSPAGHQPMCDPETGNWVTFNGEIYNYREVRRELQKLGQVFHSQTDTEVILKAYAAWGRASVRHLRGIFAFGIWDQRASRLFLARDQLGVKPLYFWQSHSLLLFASEVRALLASELVPRRLDLQGLRSYLAYGSLQEPLTLVQGVRSLLPGHTLVWQNGKSQIERYWQLPSPQSVASQTPANVLEEVAGHLAEAVALQLVADVPLGAFLSGGIDSTAIVALMKQASGGSVKTFSIVFDEEGYDERAYSQIAARYIGTEHTELLLRGDDVRHLLPQALAAFDQPSQDGLNTYFVSKVTREAGLTVALSGVGGDELFGGYNEYQKPLLLDKWGKRAELLPTSLRGRLAALLHFIPRLGEATRKTADLLRSKRHPYFIARQLFGTQQVAELLLPEALKASQDWEPTTFSQLERETDAYDPINRASALELQTYLLSTLLRDTDQMSMAHALEVRVPLLDHKLIEYLFTLPGTCKLESGQPKPLLTRSLGDALPQACVHRPKQGFELPFALWLRDSLQEEIRSTFLDQSLNSASPFSPKGLEQVWAQFESGRLYWSRVWGIFVLRRWLIQNKVG